MGGESVKGSKQGFVDPKDLAQQTNYVRMYARGIIFQNCCSLGLNCWSVLCAQRVAHRGRVVKYLTVVVVRLRWLYITRALGWIVPAIGHLQEISVTRDFREPFVSALVIFRLVYMEKTLHDRSTRRHCNRLEKYSFFKISTLRT